MLIALALVVALYGTALALLTATQRSFIYPRPDRPWPAAPGFETIRYPAGDGLQLRALYRPPAPGMPTVLFFHGNGDSLSGSLVATQHYAAAGYGLLLHEYRGYADNPGTPDEAGLYADGRGALRWLHDRGTAAGDVVLLGFSLGTGVAAQLATEQPVHALVLISPYTRMPDVVNDRLHGLVPARWLVRDRFATIDKLPAITASLLILHDRSDPAIGFEHALALARSAPDAQLIAFSGYGHQLGYADAAQLATAQWIAALPAKVRLQ